VTVRADDDAGAGDPAVDALRAEPEPAWADEIRRGRRERAARLRSVFAAFDDDDDDEDDGDCASKRRRHHHHVDQDDEPIDVELDLDVQVEL
jgi:hypothetical protein